MGAMPTPLPPCRFHQSIFFQNDGSHVPTLFGIQSLENGERITRTVVHIVIHPVADISIGHLGGPAVQNIPEIPTPPVFIISTKELNIGDEVKTYAYRKACLQPVAIGQR